MTTRKTILGRVPTYAGDWVSNYVNPKTGHNGYPLKKRVTLYGSEFQSLMEDNTYAPATLNQAGTQITFDTVHWQIISNGTDPYLFSSQATAMMEALQEEMSDLEEGAAKGMTAYQKPSGGIPKTDLASGVQDSLDAADSAYQLPSGGIPDTDLSSAVQTSLGNADSAYQKPSGGIPSADMSSAVQTSLGKADTALQSHQDITGKADKSEMSVQQGTGGNAGKTTIQLKSGTSATVLTDTLINVTYSDLVTLRNGGNLVKGQFYRITDFVTTVNSSLTEVRSAGHAFDLIVQALDVDVLSEDAHAIQHAGDTYFQNSNLEAWLLKYSLDNDTTRFEWADSTNGKGVIWRMVDEFENDIPYDFKNVQYKRYITENRDGIVLNTTALSDSNYGHTAKGTVYTLSSIYGTGITSDNYAHYLTRGVKRDVYLTQGSALTGTYVGYDLETEVAIDPSAYYVCAAYGGRSSNHPIYIKVTNDYVWCYTFHLNSGNTESVDASLNDGDNIRENEIGDYYSNDVGHTVKCTLPKIVFAIYTKSSDYVIRNNKIGDTCYSLTFGQNIFSNMFRQRMVFCCMGSTVRYNNFSPNFYYGVFGGNVTNNNISGNCSYWVCGRGFQGNVMGTFQGLVTKGSFVENAAFGTNLSCVFGDDTTRNTLLSIQHSEFGNHFTTNLVNVVTRCKIEKDYFRNSIIEQNAYITITSTQTTSSAAYLQNIKICQGVGGTSEAGRKTISHNTVNDTAATIYQSPDTQIVSI